MPEGPEIRREADALDRALAGQQLTRCTFAFRRLKRFESRIRGQRVDRVTSHGKALLIRVQGGLTIFSHNQLYGRWYVTTPGRTPNTRRSLRLALENHKKAALLYSASEIEVLTADEIREHPFLARLGPDILDHRTTPSAIKRRLGTGKFCNRSLAALFLDQSFLAGLGNYLRSEILFDARVHPDARPVDLSEDRLSELARSIRRISRRTYRHEGLCTEPADYRRFRRRGEPHVEARFHVYQRDGLPCRTCGSRIIRAERASRAVFLCRKCQR